MRTRMCEGPTACCTYVFQRHFSRVNCMLVDFVLGITVGAKC